MNKLFVLALVVASATSASPSLAATKKKPASGANLSVATPPTWADMPNGKPHKLRNLVDIHDAKAKDWDTHAVVTLTDAITPDAGCQWVNSPAPAPPTPVLTGAQLFVQNVSGKPMLYLLSPDGKSYVARPFTYESSSGNSRWLASESDTDWNYYVFLENGTPTTTGRMVKRYRVEAFPPARFTSTTCNNERPPSSVKLASNGAAGQSMARTCQTSGGAGNEPNH